jgi:hypothetical protein
MRMSPSDNLRAAIVNRLAAQWIALGGQLVGDPDRTVIDIEALVAATTEMDQADARVREVALDWCIVYGRAVNGSRLKTVAAEIAVDEARLGAFAATVAASGGPRWPVATSGPLHASRGKVVVSDLAAPSRLAWRLRASFGVNARADILVALAALPGRPVTVADLARRTRFTKRNVAVAVSSMALAGVLEVARFGNEDRVQLAPDLPLRSWLDVPSTAAIDWTSRWKAVLAMLRVAEAMPTASPAVRAVELRAALASLLGDLPDAHLPKPGLSIVGADAAAAYDAWLDRLADVLGDVSA